MSFPLKGIFYEGVNMTHCQAVGDNGRRDTCSDIEINASDCLEAYGILKGRSECAKFIEDLQECRYGALRRMRHFAMRVERFKQVASGKRSWENRWGTPIEFDSYTWGIFTP